MEKYTTKEIAEAIFTVNKHAKTAIHPRYLYALKNNAIKKLLKEGRAKKLGLHYGNSQRSMQSSAVSIACGDYLFHTTPTKADFAELPHLGYQDENYRNPHTVMNFKLAKTILTNYTGLPLEGKTNKIKEKATQRVNQPVFTKLGDGHMTFPAQSFRRKKR